MEVYCSASPPGRRRFWRSEAYLALIWGIGIGVFALAVMVEESRDGWRDSLM